ncbi:60S ribosomal protein L7/L12 [Coprinopsis cinerea okayama7|uniref:60S ribosomal protein L7/L12 n=1 Tax=Coprinopsis cinerea (strain Okayama-7 / 130 / ATCC MYA-4618 / FGSC 9003) TaxID=240176 RepID=A8NYB6_COPC7|nr:putative mitochondrial 54S ribosomal protein MNP1 [Coprinopsis cinerea okayama7\|eukprot:XP_001837387.2 putative mitochondrial 54S ribosomal protein MNP1 [Coprinopsis cinerea okayama7\
MASRCSGALRLFSRSTTFSQRPRTLYALRYASTEAAPASTSTPPPPPTADPKISRIVDDISGLTLLQAADLVTQLKTRLNIQEIAMPAAAPAAAPAGGAAAASDEPAAEKPKEKTVFNVKLESFDAGSKPKIIREVKALVPNLTLIDAKKFVESLPKMLKENLSKEDAEKLKKAFEDLGAVVKLE